MLTAVSPTSQYLEILCDINACPQIPPDKQIDIRLPAPAAELDEPDDLDGDIPPRKPWGAKRLEDLLKDVPHLSLASLRESNASLVAELEKDDKETYPAHFLTADDVENYRYDFDMKQNPEAPIPSLAPHANPDDHPPLHPLLRNPNSSTSWLRRHAPHIFLQTHEHEPPAPEGDHDDGTPHHGTTGRKSRGGAKGERGGKASTRGRRSGVAALRHSAEKGNDADVSMDDDGDRASTPVPKGKRKRDDDPGYRPKGGSGSRPSKKKRKSEGPDGTPTTKKSRKESLAAGDD